MTDQTKTSERHGRTIGLAIVLVVIVVLGAAWYLTPSSSTSTSTVVTLPASSSAIVYASTSASSSLFDLASTLLSGSPPTLGSPNASVTIVEFGDFQCPNCGEWFRTQQQQVIQKLIKTGRAKLLWRDFDFWGPDSTYASEAAYAAGEQGKFWEFHDLLYSNQQTPNNGWASRDNLKQFAKQLGLDMTQFNQSFDNGKYTGLINANFDLGKRAGVTGTPTFLLIGPNGKIVTIAGDQPESVFEQAIASLTGG